LFREARPNEAAGTAFHPLFNGRKQQRLNQWMAATLYGSGIERGEGTQCDDVIVGNHLNNRLSGNGGNDLLDGAGGSDYLLGGDGKDNMYGGNGSDWLDGRPARTG
jgi:Ca2+-binding RTX toxin-like protein